MNTALGVAKFVGTFVGGSAVLLGALAWLLRTWFNHGLSRDLANHAAALDRATQIEAARLQHDLELVAADVVKRTTLLNEKRAEVVAELYKRLVEFLFAAESFAAIAEYSGEPPKEEKAKILGDKAQQFHEYFHHHRIYFSEKLCDGLQELFRAVTGPTMSFRMWMRLAENNAGRSVEKYHESWDAAWKAIQEVVPPLRTKVEKEFRDLLGVKDPA